MPRKKAQKHEESVLRIPGFTAEASLYAADERYRWAYSTISAVDGGGVLLQFCFANEGGTTCCNCYYGWCYCRRLPRAVLQ
jgi:hypothetical protein